ncbi:MAG: tetratricopeptide repeat protein [Chthoniobacterales bacterium]
METPLEKTERTYIKLIMGSFGALIVFILICWGGFRFYRHWEEGHLVRKGAAFLSGGDLKTASLYARRAWQLNDQNPDAARIVAQISEKTGDRTALDWRRKVLELNPNSADDALALVRCALWFNDLATAEKTLAAFGEKAREKPEYHAALGRLAEIKHDVAGAEREWTRATELAPNDSAYRFQLALTRLSMNDQTKRAEALRVMEELRGDPAQRASATRTLLIDSVANRSDAQRIRTLANELQAYPESIFSDRIMYLEILRQLHDAAYDEYLARLKSEVPAKASDLAALLSWMTRNHMNDEAVAYANSLPADALTNWPVPLALAETYAQLKNWLQLEKLTRTSNWSAYDPLRRAYLARALRGQEKQLASEQELAAAQKEAATNPQMLSTLTQTIADWGWQNEAIDLLWVLTKNQETKMSALQTLYEHYTKVADTSGLYRTLSKFAEMRPNDAALQNNLAQVSLLLGVDLDYARKVAADLKAKEPTNAAYLSTYAFSLLSKGDVKGALQVMDGLSADQLRDPSIATYYGVVLAAAGQKEKAREFLRRSSEASLLPEEKALVTKAQNSLE